MNALNQRQGEHASSRQWKNVHTKYLTQKYKSNTEAEDNNETKQ
jgi:hypothetical protein